MIDVHAPGGGTMGNKDRVGHSAKRQPTRTQAEKRQAKRERRKAHDSGKRGRRRAAAHHGHR